MSRHVHPGRVALAWQHAHHTQDRRAAGAVIAGAATAAPPPAIELRGEGVQIYVCATTQNKIAWKLKAPEATLRDASGHVAGRHFAGPIWRAADGSQVVGTLLVASAAPDQAAIPWLVLKAATHAGAGRFADVTYVTRTHMRAGTAPTAGCGAAHPGAETRVPYSATYSFFTQAGP